VDTLSEWSRSHVRVRERVDEAPELVWRAATGAATAQHAAALLDYAREERERVALEEERQSLDFRVRQHKARAERAEADAEFAKARQVRAKLELAARFKELGVVPVRDQSGELRIISAPALLRWQELEELLLANDPSSKPGSSGPALEEDN